MIKKGCYRYDWMRPPIRRIGIQCSVTIVDATRSTGKIEPYVSSSAV